MQFNKTRISLCMIVRNEESVLGRCLESARRWVDDIVIVDTGSTDGSVAIAKKHGARVFEHAWADDFAAARNAALEHATGQWILSLGADEVMEPSLGRDLRRISAQGNHVGAHVPLHDRIGGDEIAASLVFRFWSNRPEIRWRYRIHEQTLPAALEVAQTEGLSVTQVEGRILRDRDGLATTLPDGTDQQQERDHASLLKEHPDDPYALYMHAKYLGGHEGREAEARKIMARAYGLLRATNGAGPMGHAFNGEVCATYSLDLQRSGDLHQAIEVSSYGVEHCAGSAHLWYAHGCALSLESRWGDAEEALVKSIGYNDDGAADLSPTSRVTASDAHKELIQAISNQGRHVEAADTAWSLAQEHPQDEDAMRLFVDMAALERDWSKTAKRLIDRVNAWPLCPTSWFKGGELFFRMRMFDQALPWVLRSADLLPDPALAHALAGECFLAAGHYEPAVDSFSRGLPDDPRCRAGILVLSLAYDVDLADPESLRDEEILAEVRRMVVNLRELGRDSITRRLHEVATRLERTDPVSFQFLETALT